MSMVSELSMQELDAERGELLPEREALQLLAGNFNFSPVTQAAANVAFTHGDHNYVDQSTCSTTLPTLTRTSALTLTPDTEISQDFSVTE